MRSKTRLIQATPKYRKSRNATQNKHKTFAPYDDCVLQNRDRVFILVIPYSETTCNGVVVSVWLGSYDVIN